MDCGCPGTAASGVARAVRSSQNIGGRKVLLFVLADDEPLTTDGLTTWRSVIIKSPPPLNRLGPFIEALKVHWYGTGFTNSFEARVVSEFSTTGELWAAPVQILPPETTDSQLISAPYTTETQFGLNMRVSIQTKNGTAGNVESGRVTAILEVVLKS